MADTQQTKFPEYVTDGFHIYLWNDEYEPLFSSGKLKPSDPPVKKKAKPLTERQRTVLEAARKKALFDAQEAVKLFSTLGAESKPIDLDE